MKKPPKNSYIFILQVVAPFTECCAKAVHRLTMTEHNAEAEPGLGRKWP